MNNQKSTRSSATTKLQQAYWEAKRNLQISLGNKDDDCMVANDAELDTKIEFLHAADTAFNALLSVLMQYTKALTRIMEIEENFASTLIEFGVKDQTKAGEIMASSGKTISRTAVTRCPLKHRVASLFHEVQTFQFKATADAFLAVAKMERVRRSYRSGLLWMKNESQTLDPDKMRKLKRFRRIQEHIRNLKVKFDRLKVEVMQKIDLYLLSRCNLFSQSLFEYQKDFCRMSKHFTSECEEASKKTLLCNSYQFKTLKNLNASQECLGWFLSDVKRSQSVLDSLSSLTQEQVEQTLVNGQPAETSCTAQLEKSSHNAKKRKPRNRKASKRVTTQDEELLVDLKDNTFDIFDNMTSALPERNRNSKEKYSDDLLSLDLTTLIPSSKPEESSQSGVFNEVFDWEECVGHLDSIKPNPQREMSDLHFWDLMESYKDDSNSPASRNSRTDTKNTPSVSKWTNVLIEFDPFLNSNELLLDKTIDELC